ncbi:hypothetical protein [Rhizobium fabae]|uniref:Lytic murein transglycosylase n=1 Tax=Rhizobium fabae TaxID=573179 RepID=A0A7W6B773_9HYPH|nr:hypothetical protein [Rhizobium fabae]MBB3913889.1 hypothetical protein [Rhizobium fabae]RUM16295.1 hypothetical protein EFB14_02950 [Rhizobium fabae]
MKRLVLTLATVLASSSAWSSTTDLDAAVIQATHYARAAMPKEDRRSLANAALAYWESFDKRIPRNSPPVMEWLNKELSTTDSARLSKVLATPEFALWTLAQTSEDCVARFNLIATASPNVSALSELYLWTRTLSCYKSPNDLLTYLKQAGLSNGRWDGPFSIQHFGFYHDTITGSLANAIIEDGRQ